MVLNGKLVLDQMNDGHARAMFSSDVENIMLQNGYSKEGEFVRLVRNALIIAADEPGVDARTRCRYVIEFDR